MKLSTKLLSSVLLLAVVAFTFSSCSKNNDSKPKARKQSYTIDQYGASTMSGKALFTEIPNSDSVRVEITLKGSKINDAVTLYGAIKGNTSLEEGNVLYELGSFQTQEKKASLSTEIELSFDDLSELNGSIAIYIPKNGDHFGTLQSVAEIGKNKTYFGANLEDEGTINGQFRAYKRDEGSYLVVKLDESKVNVNCQGEIHPVQVFDEEDFGVDSLAIDSLKDGVSATLLSNISYDDLKKSDNTIKVFCSKEHDKKVIATAKFK